MKKIRSLFLMVLVAILVSGCYDYKVNMVIKDDKSVDFALHVEIDTTMLEGMMDQEMGSGSDNSLDTTYDEPDISSSFDSSSLINEQNVQALKDKGFKVVTSQEENVTKVDITKTYSNIDDISSSKEVTVALENITSPEFDDSQFFTTTKKGVYKANFSFNGQSQEGMEGMDIDEDTASMFDISYTVTLPQKSISNNATSVSEDGKTLTWKLSMTNPVNVNYEFSFENSNNMLIYIAIGIVGLLVVVGLIIAVVGKGKKRKTNTTSQPVQPMTQQSTQQPVQPMMQQPTQQPVQPMTQQPTQQPVQPMTQQPTQQPVQPMMQQPTQQPGQKPMTVDELLNNNSNKSV